MKLRTILFGICFASLCAMPAISEVFRFKYAEGDSYRINSLVTQTVHLNRILSHSAEITNRIAVTVSNVKTENGIQSATHTGIFMTSERNSNRSFVWGQEYESIFTRDAFGVYDIPDRYFMPVVRNVPTFPEYDIAPGASWKGSGEEAHDLRSTFKIQTPFTVPFDVTYTYVGPVEKEGKKLHHITASYTLFFDTPESPIKIEGDYPITTMGYSQQNIYWDNDLGLVEKYNETFRIQLQLASGNLLEFRGTAEAYVTETELMDREKIVQEMNDEISRLGIENTRASSTDEGITITLENIQFEPDSARLLPNEKEKIVRISALLERYPDKELLISGHTALAGTKEARQQLSEERAAAVAQFLIENGVRTPYNVYTRGFGAEKPVAPNTSEEFKARNRRVEITILEK